MSSHTAATRVILFVVYRTDCSEDCVYSTTKMQFTKTRVGPEIRKAEFIEPVGYQFEYQLCRNLGFYNFFLLATAELSSAPCRLCLRTKLPTRAPKCLSPSLLLLSAVEVERPKRSHLIPSPARHTRIWSRLDVSLSRLHWHYYTTFDSEKRQITLLLLLACDALY